MSVEHDNTIEVNIKENIKMCLDAGYGMLISSKHNSDYRNAIILVHNGLELIMKLYLETKSKYLIYEHLDRYLLLHDCIDQFAIEKKMEINKKARFNTISFTKCMELLAYFENISIPDINKLNDMRNDCVHFRFTIYKSAVKKLLVSKMYPLIKQIANSLSLNASEFTIHSSTQDAWCNKINDEIHSKYIQIIAAAKKHYLDELTETDRAEKNQHENYTVNRNNILVQCPACNNNSLLERRVKYNISEDEGIRQTTKSLALKSLSCHHCGLIVNDRYLLLIDFSNSESSNTTSIRYSAATL